MTKPTLFLALAVVGLLAGCGKTSASDDPATPGAAQTNSEVKNAPDAQAAPGAAYRIVPPDPNDPKFRPDPKLAGGG